MTQREMINTAIILSDPFYVATREVYLGFVNRIGYLSINLFG